MNPSAAVEQGAYTRMTSDEDLSDLLGTGTRVFPGFPHEVLKEAGCPRLTFYVFGPSPLVKGVERVRCSIDIWVWATQGRRKLLDLDERLQDLFEARFSYEGHWIHSVPGGFRDHPAGPDEPMRRTRDIVFDVAATTAA